MAYGYISNITLKVDLAEYIRYIINISQYHSEDPTVYILLDDVFEQDKLNELIEFFSKSFDEVDEDDPDYDEKTPNMDDEGVIDIEDFFQFLLDNEKKIRKVLKLGKSILEPVHP